MQRDPRAFLWDVREASLAIQSFTQDMDAMAYENNELVKAAVERKFEVIGEALNQPLEVGCLHGSATAELDHRGSRFAGP